MGSPYSWLGPAMSDLDDLMAAFAGVNVDDHDELVETFARVLGTDGGSARFFLEASQWNLEVALGNFLDTVGSRVSGTRLAPPFLSLFRAGGGSTRACVGAEQPGAGRQRASVALQRGRDCAADRGAGVSSGTAS